MSANNFIHIFPQLKGDDKVTTKWVVEEKDMDTGSSIGILGDDFPTLESAVQIANNFMAETEVEYGLHIDT